MNTATRILFMPAWLNLARAILGLLYPFALIWAAVQLITVNGPSFWVILVIGLLILARPKFPTE